MRRKVADSLPKKIGSAIGGAIVSVLAKRNANMATFFKVLVICTSICCVTLLTLLIFIRSMPSTHAPDVVGQPLVSAILSLQERSLVPFVKIEYNDSTTQVAGTILKQRPSAGSYVRTGQKIELIVHSGSETVTMPNLVGTAFDNVQNAVLFLDSTGSIEYRIDTVTYDYSDLPVGTIMLQTPSAGETVGYFTDIHVVVSLGPQAANNVQIPNLIGVHYQVALSQIIASAIRHSIVIDTTQNRDTAKDLTIIAQSPPSGTISSEQTVAFGLQPPSQLPVGQYFDIHTSDLSAYTFGSDIEIVRIDFTPESQDENNHDADQQPLPPSEQLLLQFKLFQDTVYLPYLLPIGSTLEIRVDGNIAETFQVGN